MSAEKSTRSRPVWLRSRHVVPSPDALIEDGVVCVQDGRIAAMGRWSDYKAEASSVVDLGDVALLPGLINAHCHLDYTGMAGQTGPARTFTDWIKLLTTLKASTSFSEFRAAWQRGAEMLVDHGTTLVADIEAVPELLPGAWELTPLRVFSFLEMTGVRSQRLPAEILREAEERIRNMPGGRCQAGFSPHAPYSTTPELLRLVAGRARAGDRVTVHLAESQAEADMFRKQGPLHDWLRGQREMDDCGVGSPVGALNRAGLLSDKLLAVHVNYLWHGDEELLAANRVSVVHCPRSHAFFGHQRFPLAALRKAGVNLCLGTDSLASVTVPRGATPVLNLFQEMQQLSAHDPGLDPAFILMMATENGAKALGRAHELGRIRPHYLADLIAIPCGVSGPRVLEAILHHDGDVPWVMIEGVWVRRRS